MSEAHVNPLMAGSMSALHLAAQNGDYRLVHELIQQGAKVNNQTQLLMTPLHFAVHSKNDSVVRLLLVWGANPNMKCYDYLTPLHLAAYEGQEGAVRFLLDHGAYANAMCRKGRTPLAMAIQGGHPCTRIIKMLHEKGGDVSIGSPLVEAVDGRREVVIKALLECGAQVDHAGLTGFTPLTAVLLRYRHIERYVSQSTKEYLKKPHWAKLSLRDLRGIRPKRRKTTAQPLDTGTLETTMWENEMKKLEFLENTDIAIASLLLSYGASVSCPDHFGNVPLQKSKEIHWVRMMKLLENYSSDSCSDGILGKRGP